MQSLSQLFNSHLASIYAQVALLRRGVSLTIKELVSEAAALAAQADSLGAPASEAVAEVESPLPNITTDDPDWEMVPDVEDSAPKKEGKNVVLKPRLLQKVAKKAPAKLKPKASKEQGAISKASRKVVKPTVTKAKASKTAVKKTVKTRVKTSKKTASKARRKSAAS